MISGPLRVTAIGLIAGLPAVYAMTRAIAALLFGVTPFDFTIVAVCCAIVLTVTLAATFWPARRAASIDPQAALNCG